MKELSLNVLDIAENSIKAGATLTEIIIDESEDTLTITIRDDGCGMKPETVLAAQNPFYTTRTTRSVGLGIPLFKMSAEMTGGSFSLSSRHKDEFPERHGTEISASFNKKHIDYTPLGDIAESVITLIQGHPDTDFEFIHTQGGKRVELKTRELRAVLEDVPLNTYDVIVWIRDYLAQQYTNE